MLYTGLPRLYFSHSRQKGVVRYQDMLRLSWAAMDADQDIVITSACCNKLPPSEKFPLGRPHHMSLGIYDLRTIGLSSAARATLFAALKARGFSTFWEPRAVLVEHVHIVIEGGGGPCPPEP